MSESFLWLHPPKLQQCQVHMNQRRLTSLVLGSDLRFTHQFWLLSALPSKHLGLLMKFRDKINRFGAKPGLCLIPRAQFMVSYFTKSLIDFLFLLFASFFKRTFPILTTDSTLNSSISVQQILCIPFEKFLPPTCLIRTSTFINFWETCHKYCILWASLFHVINIWKIPPTLKTKDFRSFGVADIRRMTAATAAVTLACLFTEWLCYVLRRLHSSYVLSTK